MNKLTHASPTAKHRGTQPNRGWVKWPLGTCWEVRGLGPEDLVEGVKMGCLELEGDWALEADKVLVF